MKVVVSTFSTTLHETIAMHLRQITTYLFSIMNKCYVFFCAKSATSSTYSHLVYLIMSPCRNVLVTVQEECGTLANSSLV